MNQTWTTLKWVVQAPDRGLDRLQEWVDRRGPRRTVSRSKTVRRARALAGRFDVRGWVSVTTSGMCWTALVLFDLGWVYLPWLAITGWSTFNVGRAWAVRNEVGELTVVHECDCDPFHDGDEL